MTGTDRKTHHEITGNLEVHIPERNYVLPTKEPPTQLVEHWHDDPEVMDSILTGGYFWRNLFCSSMCKDLSDNLTEMHIMKNQNMSKFCYNQILVDRLY